MTVKNKRPVSYEVKRRYIGYAFIVPWIFGFIYLTVIPLAESLIYSISNATINAGYIDLQFVGFAHYEKALFGDAKFLPALWETLSGVLLQAPIIVVFSLIMAMLLNQEFKGRVIARSIFFMPVIIAGSVVMNLITEGSNMESMMAGEVNNGGLFQSDFIGEVLKNSGLGADLINTINTLVNDIFNLTWQSGIQILIFLAALQSVEGTLYEVAKVEGATAWETFWRVTFPMIMPMLIINVLYTVIDNYISVNSAVFQYIQEYTDRIQFDYAAAMAWMNFVVLFIVIMVLYVILNRRSKQ